MISDDGVDGVVFEKARNAGVMFAFGPGIVEPVPTHVKFTPAFKSVTGHTGKRHATGSTPARIDVALQRDWNAYVQRDRLSRVAQLCQCLLT